MKKIIRKKKPFAKRPFTLVYFFIAVLSATTLNVKAVDSIAIIPKPLAMQVHDGHFVLTNSTAVTTTSSDADVKQSIQWFLNKIAASTGYHLSTKRTSKNAISLVLNKHADTSLHDEGYTLKVAPSMVTICL